MRIRILVVEDESLLADSIVCGLREEGYSVELASGRHIARRALLTKHWDLVVFGRRSPGSNEHDMLRVFRESNQATPAVFLTAPEPLADPVQRAASADNYLCQPFGLDQLLTCVNSLLRRRQPPGSMLRYADLSVDPVTQRVERARHVIELTAKEYSLLLYLLDNAEYVLSRTQLYEHVWGGCGDGVSNTLEVHVRALRRKLETVGDRLIQTVRGRGYKLQAVQPIHEG